VEERRRIYKQCNDTKGLVSKIRLILVYVQLVELADSAVASAVANNLTASHKCRCRCRCV
jgi:hypothetical protein